MLTVLIATVFLVASIAVHLMICRISPDKSLKAKLFIVIAAAALGGFLTLGLGLHLPLVSTAAVIYVLCVPVYLIFYVSTELVSPSKKILQVIESSGGCTYEIIVAQLKNEDFIISRLKELEQSGCAVREGGRYVLTASGWKIAKVLDGYQKILGRSIGG
jgi:hypothetical protein